MATQLEVPSTHRRVTVLDSLVHIDDFVETDPNVHRVLVEADDPEGAVHTILRVGAQCQEPYIPAGDLEAQVEQLYERIQLPKSWLKRLREELEAEITARQHRNAAERELLTRKLAKADTERRKLLDAYYANAIGVATLKAEQARIAIDVHSAEERLAAVDAHLAEWQEILETALRFATNCATAYTRASAPTRRRFNQAVFTRIDIRDGKIAPTWGTTRRLTCSFLRASSNTAIWWS